MTNGTEPVNPYSPPRTDAPSALIRRAHRGPTFYLAVGGLSGILLAIPLVVAIPIYADPNPIGYLLMLLGIPLGGVVYRASSRNWQIDENAEVRQLFAAFATLLLPASTALLTGMREVGFTIVSGVISLSLIVGLLLAGNRRQPGE